MPVALKQSTASQEVALGYFVDFTDGNTEETGLTIANTDIKIWKNGATTLANKNSGGATHISNGIYYATLDATDTDTLGPMVIFVHVTGALPVRLECEVLPANVYDSLYSTDKLQVDCVEKSSAALDLTTTEKASINTEVDNALNTAIPGSPTADSINERVAAIDDLTQAAGSGDLAAIKTENDTHPTLAEIEASSVLALEATLTAIKGTGFDTATDSLVKIHDDHVTYLTAAPSTHAAADIWTVGTRALTDKAGFSLSSAGIDAIIDDVVEGTLTLRQAVRIIVSALVNKSTGGGTATLTSRDLADTKARVTLTVDANGNRTASTVDGT